MQKALIRTVCIAPGTTRNESVAGLNRNDTPSPTCSGSAWPRRVCTTNAFGGTSTVFQRQKPVIRTSRADVAGAVGAAADPVGALARPAAAGVCRGLTAWTIGALAGPERFARRFCSSCSCWATTWSRYSLRCPPAIELSSRMHAPL